MEKLLQFLRYISPISAALEEHLSGIITYQAYRKGEFLLRESEIARRISFIEKGLVRSYYLAGGEEISNWFMKEGDVCISIVSFLRQEPSDDTVIALEDCQTWGISYGQLEETYKLFPEFERHGRLITGNYYVWSEKRHQAILRKTPIQKYKRLMETDPELASRVPVKDLASFLNISKRNFSRIRRKYAAKQRKGKSR